jgi:hypothetical protein
MVKITLEPARNGVIKKIDDTNHGGSSAQMTVTDVYEIDPDSEGSTETLTRFIYEICEDLGLDVGNKFSPVAMQINFAWGSHYEPSAEEINERIRELEAELEVLKAYQNDRI